MANSILGLPSGMIINLYKETPTVGSKELLQRDTDWEILSHEEDGTTRLESTSNHKVVAVLSSVTHFLIKS